MRTLPTTLQVARNVLWNDKAWLWFLEIEASANRFFRLVRNTRHVAANSRHWQAAQFDLEIPTDDGSGSLGRMTAKIADVSRTAVAYAEVDGEFIGRGLTVYLMHESALATFLTDLSWRHDILAVSATEKAFALECGHPSEGQQVPRRVIDRRTFPQLVAGAGTQVFRS